MSKNNSNKVVHSALKVKEGISQPSSINQDAVTKLMKRKHSSFTEKEYVNGVLEGNRTVLSKAITLIESSLPSHYNLAQRIIEKCIPYSGNSIRIGITGVPGVGKSTFIESLGKRLTSAGRKLAVLAIDPSSERTKGSILGDKTRMEELAVDPNAFIRPSPSAGTLGGVARKTRESIILCEAAGFDTIFVETVGVGQSETAVSSMVDFFILLMLAGAGDELQGIKRGIMEMADAIFINKADGDNINRAMTARIEYQNALHLFPPTASGWIPVSEICSSKTNEGIDKVWEIINEYVNLTQKSGYFNTKRLEQAKYRMYEFINEQLKSEFYQCKVVEKMIKALESDLLDQKISSYAAAQKLLVAFHSCKIN
jgi:LAO/AO transport system kinase